MNQKNLLLNKRMLCGIILWIGLSSAIAQKSYIKTFNQSGWSAGYDLVETSDHGFVVTGYINPSDYRMMIFKTDSGAKITDAGNYTITGDEGGYHVKATADGGFIIMGYTYSGNGYSLLVLKLDANRVKQWERIFGSVYLTNFSYTPDFDGMQTTDGNFVVTALADSMAVIAKLNSNGDSLWLQQFGFASNVTKITSISESDNGSYIAAGTYTDGSTSRTGGYVLKLNPANGQKTGENNFFDAGGAGKNITLADIENTGQNNAVLAVGIKDTFLQVSSVDAASLNVNWTKDIILGFSNGLSASALSPTEIERTRDNNYIISGFVKSGSDRNAFLLKIDSSGNVLWKKIIADAAGTYNYFTYHVQPTYDGGYALAGTHQLKLLASSSDVFVIKTDAEGKVCNNFPAVISVITDTVPAGSPTTFTPVLQGGNGAVTYAWSGDDGFSSSNSQPSYTFPSGAGTYNFTVATTDNSGCKGLYTGKVTVGTVGIENLLSEKRQLLFSPNPFQTSFELLSLEVINKEGVLNIYNVIGEKVYSQVLPSGSARHIITPPAVLPAGIYYIEIWEKNKQLGSERRDKIIKVQ